MSTPIRVDGTLWDGDAAGVVGTWYVNDGEPVTLGAVIVDIMYEKVQIGIESPAAGRLSIVMPEGREIRKGDVIATIE